MSFRYNVTIKGASNTIEFNAAENNNDSITGVKFGFNSNNSTRERDRNGRIEITLYGRFNGEESTITPINRLSEWAKSDKDWYRDVTIVLYTADNNDEESYNVKRTYHFDKMFCIDYFEYTGSALNKQEERGLEFQLIMAQAPTYKISETKFEYKEED